MAISTKGGQKLELMIGDIGIEFSQKNQGFWAEIGSFVNQGRNNQSCRLRPVPARLRISYAAKPETVDKVCEIVRKRLALSSDNPVTGA
ncbi:hypothetical protein PVK06_007916 [Gossypium arboreum]|uniref:Uncharacterized protein n=1 Tax=Gossypium arboreum TaxID=29729 RepID=A0ABR0QJC2_GOSAR|nr:hypothetical protein PVK06_007916 [Gossypium arboreum]